MNSIEKAVFTLKGFTDDSNILESLSGLQQLLLEANSDNVGALCSVGDIEVRDVDISDLTWTEDYDIVTGYYYVDGQQYTEEEKKAKEDELSEAINELEDIIVYFEDEIDGLHGELKTYERCSSDIMEPTPPILSCEYKIKNIEDSLKASEEKLETLKDDLCEFENAEFRYDEVMWNTVFDYGSVDVELAQKCGLAVVDVRGTECLSIIGCGMDLSPDLIAYEALYYGYVSPEHARKLDRETDYCKHVMGVNLFNEVVKELGIKDAVRGAVEKNNKKMELFDKAINELAVKRDSGEIDKNLATVSALSILSKAL